MTKYGVVTVYVQRQARGAVPRRGGYLAHSEEAREVFQEKLFDGNLQGH